MARLRGDDGATAALAGKADVPASLLGILIGERAPLYLSLAAPTPPAGLKPKGTHLDAPLHAGGNRAHVRGNVG